MKAQEKILVFCSREICYLSGNFFAHQLAGAFEEAGYETTVCEFTSKDDRVKVIGGVSLYENAEYVQIIEEISKLGVLDEI